MSGTIFQNHGLTMEHETDKPEQPAIICMVTMLSIVFYHTNIYVSFCIYAGRYCWKNIGGLSRIPNYSFDVSHRSAYRRLFSASSRDGIDMCMSIFVPAYVFVAKNTTSRKCTCINLFLFFNQC